MNNNELVIDVTGLSKSFHGKPAVVDVDIKVHRGEIFGFLGPNGGGKTTSIRMLCGLLTPDKGEGTCLGFDIKRQSYEIKKNVGYMTQHFSLYEDLTIYENLDFIGSLYQLKNKKEKIASALQELNLVSRKNQLAGTLSGGYKQRLALSAALLHEPKLLLLDEPTAGVDPRARRDFWQEIHLLSSHGITTLVSTHYMDEAARCHRMLYISQGRILVYGTEKEILEKVALSTWEVTNCDLIAFENSVKKMPGIDQTAIFGNSLHVSGYHAEQLEETIKTLQKNPVFAGCQLLKSEAGLEDVFISLAGRTEKI